MRGQLVDRFGDPPRWAVRCDNDSHDVPQLARHADPVSVCRSAQTINVGSADSECVGFSTHVANLLVTVLGLQWWVHPPKGNVGAG